MSLGRKIASLIQDHGAETAIRGVESLVAEGKIKPEQVSLRDLAENIVGHDWAHKMQMAMANPYASPFMNPGLYRGSESGDAVSGSAFSAITGNLLIDKIAEGYNASGFIGDKLVQTIPVTHGNLDTIKEPWLGDIGTPAGLLTSLDDTDEDLVDEGKEYQGSDFQPNYRLLARPKKRGRRCDVTFEMIYADRTRQAYEKANSVGNRVRRSKEYRILKVVAGITTNYRFSFAGRPEIGSATYVTVNGAGNSYAAGERWINHLDSNPLTNWSDLNQVEQLFNQMRDPNTGEPIEVEADTILVMPPNLHNARHIIHATNLRTGPGGSTSTDNTANVVFDSANTVQMYNILTSKYMYKLLTTKIANETWIPSQDYVDDGTLLSMGADEATTLSNAAAFWWVGNFKKAFYYREVYPLRMVQAPPQNPLEFDRDIVLSIKAQEFGVAGVLDPRYVVRCAGHDFETSSD